MSNTIYPLALNNNNKLTSVGYWKPLFLFNIPANTEHATVDWIFPDRTVKPMMQFTFYCDSIRKDSVVDLNTFNDPDVDSSGCGSREKPWRDLNYALECIQCFARTVCDGNFAFRLILTGEVNYAIGSANRHINGYGRVLVDCTDAIFALDVDIQAVASDGYAFRFLCGISFSGIVEATYKVSAYGNIDFAVISDCNMCVFDIENLKVEIPVNETKYPAAQTVVGALRCSSCRIRCATAEFDTQHVVIGAGSWQVFGFNNNQCEFTDVDISMAVSAASNSRKVSQDLVACYGFYANTDCVFDGCTATSVAVSASPGIDNIAAYGCGWDENSGSIWIGRNIGFCRYYENGDTTNESALVYVPECTLNSDCETPLTPPSSSSSEEPPPDGFKGSVLCKIIPRAVTAETYPYSYEVNQSTCLYTWYTLRLGFCNNITDLGASDRTRATVKSYGNPIMRFQGERGYDEDGNLADYCEDMWEFYDCSYNDAHVSELPKVCRDASADIDRLIDGTLGLPPVKEEPYTFPTDGWLGYTQWSLQRNWRGDSEYTLRKSGDTLPVTTEYGTTWYDVWGDTPCGSGMYVTTSLMLHCVVFFWIPDNENGKKPTKVKLKSPDGTVKEYKFGVEYCLQGKDDIDINGLHYSVCEDVSMYDDCAQVVPNRVNSADPESDADFEKTVKVERKYVYQGVK